MAEGRVPGRPSELDWGALSAERLEAGIGTELGGVSVHHLLRCSGSCLHDRGLIDVVGDAVQIRYRAVDCASTYGRVQPCPQRERVQNPAVIT